MLLAIFNTGPARVSLVRRGAAPVCSGTVGIVGGGLAGVTAAKTLADAGVPVVLHERSARLGGRLGVVEVDGQLVGSACSYLKAKDPEFVKQVEQWRDAGLVVEWTPAPHVIAEPGTWSPISGADAERWFVGVPNMASPASALAEHDNIQVRASDVYDCNYEASKWIVAAQPPLDAAATNAVVELDAEVPVESHIYTDLILALPVHETSELLDRKILDAALGRGRHKDFVKERVSVAVVFERSLELPFGFAALTYAGSPVTVAVCESSRLAAGAGAESGAGADSGAAEIWILQSATDWAKTALDEEMEPEEMAQTLLSEFAAALGRSVATLPTTRACEAIVWPYGDMDYEIEGGCVWRDDLRLALAGDWAYTGRAEGAWLSGRAAAQKLLHL